MAPQEGQPELGIAGIEDVVEVASSPTSTTYAVRDSSSGKEATLVVLASPLDDATRSRFETEQAKLASLGAHPNLVSVLGTGVAPDGRSFVACEALQGATLSERISRGERMASGDALRAGVRLAGALESVHLTGVVHGDLGPEDIRITPLGDPQICDVGLAPVTGFDVTAAGDLARLAFTAPELIDGAPASRASDVYALGATLFALVSGQMPFVGAGDDVLVRVVKRIAVDPVTDLRPQGVPDPLAAVLEQAMAKDAAQRQSSAQEFGRACQQAEVTLGLPVTEMTVLTESGSPTPPPTAPIVGAAALAAAGGPPAPGAPPASASGPPPGGPPGGPPATSGGSKVPVLIGIVVVLALIAGAVAFFALKKDDQAAPVVTTITTSTTSATSTTSTTSTTAVAAVVPVTDDLGQLSLSLPASWVGIETSSLVNATGPPSPRIVAAPDLASFIGASTTFNSTGAFVVVIDTTGQDIASVGLDAVLDGVLGQPDDLSGQQLKTVCPTQARDDIALTANGFTGRGEVLAGCTDGPAHVGVGVMTKPGLNAVVVVVAHSLNTTDDADIEALIESINVTNFP